MNDEVLLDKKRFLIWLVLTLVFMTAIFIQSQMPYHSQDTKPMLKRELTMLPAVLPDVKFQYDGSTISSLEPYDFIDFFIRKMGHVTEYAILTALVLKTLSHVRMKTFHKLGMGGTISFLYACSDEWHQSFVRERTGHIVDVLVPDLAGILLVVLGYGVILLLRNRAGRTAELR